MEIKEEKNFWIKKLSPPTVRPLNKKSHRTEDKIFFFGLRACVLIGNITVKQFVSHAVVDIPADMFGILQFLK